MDYSRYWLLGKLNIQEIDYSGNWIFGKLIIQDIDYSENWIFKKLIIPEIDYSENWLFGKLSSFRKLNFGKQKFGKLKFGKLKFGKSNSGFWSRTKPIRNSSNLTIRGLFAYGSMKGPKVHTARGLSGSGGLPLSLIHISEPTRPY